MMSLGHNVTKVGQWLMVAGVCSSFVMLLVGTIACDVVIAIKAYKDAKEGDWVKAAGQTHECSKNAI